MTKVSIETLVEDGSLVAWAKGEIGFWHVEFEAIKDADDTPEIAGHERPAATGAG